MNASDTQRKNRPSAAARAEAAAWVARLHGPNRTPDVEAGFRRWLAEDPERAAAFELLTDTWEKSARLRRRPMEHVASWELPEFRMSFSRAAVVTAAVAVLAVISTVSYLRNEALATAVGERRTLVLEDGSRIHLNTATRVAVRYDKQERRVELKAGEALFEVAKQPNRPFVVTAGDQQVRALGTSFVVRREERRLAVTLVEGKVTVAPAEFDIRVSAPDEITILNPGERLTIAAAHPPQIDRPSLDRVTAWQRGQVALDNTPLADAVAEMNRYSNVQIVIEGPSTATIQVSGIFRAGDSESFAQAVAKTYALRVVNRSREIVLAGAPRAPAVTTARTTITATEGDISD